MLHIQNIKLSLEEQKDNTIPIETIKKKICQKLKCNLNEIMDIKIFKKSIDARKKQNIQFVYTADVSFLTPDIETHLMNKYGKKGISPTPDMSYEEVSSGNQILTNRPVIVGSGPSGLFATLLLSKRGYSPILIERGDEVDNRIEKIDAFWKSGILDTNSNVQFGEGGAGTFSDGKLTTLINDKRCRHILQLFIECGAPQDILYNSKPHIGTDILRKVVKNIRSKIIEYGGEVRFLSQLTDIVLNEHNELHSIVLNENEEILCDVMLLGIGHSARDTFEMLFHHGINMIPKSFSIGVRIEHPQKLVNIAQYGDSYNSLVFGSADYKLVYHSTSGRSAYTFCMCPGGYVVAAASEENMLVTNGMSEYKRDADNANSALLVGVTPDDFGGPSPLDAIEFQRRWERRAFELGGNNYSAPIQRVGDFLGVDMKHDDMTIIPSYRPGVKFADLKNCLPDYVIDTMKEALISFDKKLKGFANPNAILTGIETRSSSPVRILRNLDHMSNIKGIYPMGEGAGYAGGIMSSAVDGLKTAEKIIGQYVPLKNSNI